MYSTTERVASNIRAEMGRQRVSQQTIAARLGISQQAVSRRLGGVTPLDVGELEVIASVLNVTASALLEDQALERAS